MPSVAVVGANWGDEGKGKVTDWLAEKADYVVRFQGGGNAGHTIINEYGTFALHLLPSGVFHSNVTNVLGPGVALNPETFLGELHAVIRAGVPEPRIVISPRAHLVLDAHVRLDRYEEDRLGPNQFGTTRSGIAPTYADKAAKIGIQVGELESASTLKRRVAEFCLKKNLLLSEFYHQPPLDSDAVYAELLALAPRLLPFVADTTRLLHDALREGKTVLLEGQLGALRDLDHGIYPFTTSCSTLAGYATVGAGIPPASLQRVIAVTKAYASAVGQGPFVTELVGESGERLRARGGHAGEYGALTGRPRRVGWFDAVATRYGCEVQGATEVALTNLDVLSDLTEIPVAVGYRLANGTTTDAFPWTSQLKTAIPVWAVQPGWHEDISAIREYSALPANARTYVETLETLIGVPISLISVGPERDAAIVRDPATLRR